MAVPISNVTRRQVYAPSGAGGAGPYAFTFEILANTDIAVYKDDVLLTLTTHYTVVINANGTGSVTITAAGLALAPASPTQYAIVGNRTISRTTDFTTGGDFFANVLNDELDQQTIFAQQNAEGLQRALQAPQTDPTSINMTLPRASDRANKTLNFDSNGNPVAGLTVTANATPSVATWLNTPTSANLRAAMTDETGTGALVFADAPTFSGNPIFSVGTANGVAYLNGSKVLTTGSALTFDGTGKLGVGTTTPVSGVSAGFEAVGEIWATTASSNANQIRLSPSTSSANIIYSTYSGAGSYLPLAFNVSGSEQMRLTSTGLKVGTTSDFSGAKVVTDGGGIGILNKGLLRSSTNGVLQVSADPNNAYASSQISFDVDGSVVATLDSSGNLGLGVAPSAWGSTWRTLEGSFGQAWYYSNTATSTGLAGNAYNNGTNWIYKTTNGAQRYELGTGNDHRWFTAPSGTAGNAISFTQAMTLNGNGALLIGQTSWSFSNNGTQIQANGRIFNTSSTDYNFELAGAQGGRLRFYTSAGGSGTTVGSITVDTTSTQYNTSSDYRLKNITGPVTNSGAYIDSLKPVEGTWKVDGSTFVGLIAHEVQEASRTSVATGVKDGPEMQAMDYSSAEIIANLIAELQSLRARVAQLESKGA